MTKSLTKYSFLMPYYDRAEQLASTLQSLYDLYCARKDFEVILVEDAKNVGPLHEALQGAVSKWEGKMSVKVVGYEEVIYNPAPMFNLGASLAGGEFLIITNPECRHKTDVLAGLDEEFDKDNSCYVVCACRSLSKDGSFHLWYQHSKRRDTNYHFCSAMSREQYWSAGGFDERYKDGYGYEDNAFRDRVKNAGIRFVLRDDLVVEHQWHPKTRPPDVRIRLQRNKTLYQKGVDNAT